MTANLAIAYRELKQYDEALVLIERSVALNANPNRLGRILMNLGVIYVEVGRLDEGILRMEEGLALTTEAGDNGGASMGRSMLADAYRRVGRYDDAIESAEQALEISRRTHDEYQESAAWHALGQALAESGELPRARSCLASALLLAERLRVPEAKQIVENIAAIGDKS